MKNISRKHKNWILIAIITALAFAMGCVFVACTKAQAESSGKGGSSSPRDQASDVTQKNGSADSAVTEENYSRWLSDTYSAKVYTTDMWLSDMLDAMGIECEPQSVFTTAHHSGIIDSENEDRFAPLTRRYVARTLVSAFGYEYRRADYAADLGADDADMSTVTYYGYFTPDDSGKVYPDAVITDEEYQMLLDEVRRHERLKGKNVLAFGDSIMFGRGNNDRGISEMISEKYGMSATDYSVSGATFGVCSGRSQIASQILIAASSPVELKPDIILIDGGTNDMELVERGDIMVGFDAENTDKKTFAGGFEYAASLLQTYWRDVPVIYIRAHDMEMEGVDDAVEQEFGEMAITIATKWKMHTIDMYNDSGFCTEQSEIRNGYTSYRAKYHGADGIHPTALGYSKFYLPIVVSEIDEIL